MALSALYTLYFVILNALYTLYFVILNEVKNLGCSLERHVWLFRFFAALRMTRSRGRSGPCST